MTDHMTYRGWRMDFDMKPIPTRAFDWSATHPDYDGEGDDRQVFAATQRELMAAIDEWIAVEAEEGGQGEMT